MTSVLERESLQRGPGLPHAMYAKTQHVSYLSTTQEPEEKVVVQLDGGTEMVESAPAEQTSKDEASQSKPEFQQSCEAPSLIPDLDPVWRLDPDSLALVKAVSQYSEASNSPSEDILVVCSCAGPGSGGEEAEEGLFVVLDGHGGRETAERISKQLPQEFSRGLACGTPRGQALVEALGRVEASLLSSSASSLPLYSSGACLVAAAIAPARQRLPPNCPAGPEQKQEEGVEEKYRAPLVVANVGDSKAVLGILYEGEVFPYGMSKLHNAANTVEVLRLQSSHPLGLKVVTNETELEDPRVLGISQVTRSFGDAYLKGVPVPGSGGGASLAGEDEAGARKRKRKKPEPLRWQAPLNVLSACPHLDSVTEELLPTSLAPACFLVLASDGLFDHLSEGEVCSFIELHVRAGKPRESVAQALVKAVIKRAAFKQNEARCTSQWLIDLKPGAIDEWNRSRREIVDDTSIIVIFF
eukprot:CAMPEP_0196584644 /NCGR_PEP_ID=MMETSP1081-20130531/47894_1 /TAXON_ID=36882 /ORGANISM="Pyramimonas amylifera, Strain CCMP720" /LENGTH=468 /DNA_ID=CAMNT_0041905923 /DNA_START=243 /DNA_END=1646 /DNA_ORIENTATION=+